MDDKKKILLGEKDIISRDNEDIFINLNLNKSFSEIRDEKYENIFDVEKQYNKERNASRNFRIYGTIDSTVVNSDGFNISIFSSSNFSNSFVETIKSSSLVYEEVNVFGKKRGKYLLELDDYKSDFVYMFIPSDGINYLGQTFIQQVVFKDADNNFVEYGTSTIDIDENGNTIGIDNDFYYFYDKHWIKKNLLITNARIPNVSFSAKTNPETISESNSNFTTFVISLDQSSIFGFEKVDLTINSKTLDNNSTEISLSDENFNPYPQPPFTLSFTPGEQNKIINFKSLSDTIFEPTENVVFELKNFQKVNPGSALTHTISVINTTPAPPPPLKKVSFENPFQVMSTLLTIKISLNSISTLGNESVKLDINSSNNNAIYLADYQSFNSYPTNPVALPITLTWSIGQKDKFITFINTSSAIYAKTLGLKITNLVNVDPGAIMSEAILIP